MNAPGAQHHERVQEAICSTFRNRLTVVHKEVEDEFEQKRQARKVKNKERVKSIRVEIAKKVEEISILQKELGVDRGGKKSGRTEEDDDGDDPVLKEPKVEERDKNGRASKIRPEFASYLPPPGEEDETEEQKKRRALRLKQVDYVNLMKDVLRLELEYNIPKALNYKLRLAAEDGVYIGARDIGVEDIRGKFELVAVDGVLILRLTDVKATVQLYDFKLVGKKRSIKMLSAIVSPSLVSLEVEGKIVIPCRFKQRSKGRHMPALGPQYEIEEDRWELDEERAVFNLKVAKKIRGAAT